VNRAAAIIACGPGRQTRSDVFCKLGLKGFSKKAKQSALLRAATHAAIRYLKGGEPSSIEPPSVEWGHPPEWALVTTPSVEGEHPLVTTPSEAKEISTRHDVPERDRKGLTQLARMKQLSPSVRKAQIQRVEAFGKRTLQGPITASNLSYFRKSRLCYQCAWRRRVWSSSLMSDIIVSMEFFHGE
jgi:hypothetical protein